MTKSELIEFFKNKDNVVELGEYTFYHADKDCHGTYAVFENILRIARNGEFFFIPIDKVRIIDNALWFTAM